MWQSNPTLKDFDPRIGFSWDPSGSGKTAIRAGFGVFDVLPLPYVYTIGDALTLPFSLQTGLGSASSPLPQGSFPNNLPAAAFNLTNAGSRFVDQHPPRSYALNWNANVQRELTRNVTATVGYVGSHTIHEPFTTDDSNQVIPTLVNGVFTWPTPIGSGTLANPNVGFIRPIFFDGSSSYEGFQSQVQMRMMHGVQAQAAYTYGKCYDDGSGAQLGDPYLNSLASLMFFDKQHRHGPCEFDIRDAAVGFGCQVGPGWVAARRHRHCQHRRAIYADPKRRSSRTEQHGRWIRLSRPRSRMQPHQLQFQEQWPAVRKHELLQYPFDSGFGKQRSQFVIRPEAGQC